MKKWKDSHHASRDISISSPDRMSRKISSASLQSDVERVSYETESRGSSIDSAFDDGLRTTRNSGEVKEKDNQEEKGLKRPMIGPEVIDYIKLIRGQLNDGKIDPTEYVSMVHQRLQLFEDGLLDDLGDAVQNIRAMKEQSKISAQKLASVPLGGLQKITNELALNVTVKERRVFSNTTLHALLQKRPLFGCISLENAAV